MPSSRSPSTTACSLCTLCNCTGDNLPAKPPARTAAAASAIAAAATAATKDVPKVKRVGATSHTLNGNCTVIDRLRADCPLLVVAVEVMDRFHPQLVPYAGAVIGSTANTTVLVPTNLRIK